MINYIYVVTSPLCHPLGEYATQVHKEVLYQDLLCGFSRPWTFLEIIFIFNPWALPCMATDTDITASLHLLFIFIFMGVNVFVNESVHMCVYRGSCQLFAWHSQMSLTTMMRSGREISWNAAFPEILLQAVFNGGEETGWRPTFQSIWYQSKRHLCAWTSFELS